MPPIKSLIGNCEVWVEGTGCGFTSYKNTLTISIPQNIKVNIAVAEDQIWTNYCNLLNRFSAQECIGNLSFVLINSKDEDSQAQSQLQDVLNLYVAELPAMNFAANTGKQSTFLKRCVSNGKYSTLLLKSNSGKDIGEVVAAVTYQIIPTDTRYAEIPLAAVNSSYQRKGIGTLMYQELSKRLQSVGISTIFCWGDAGSEGFWLKQGFWPKGEVDSKGKTRGLRVKADIRKALCFPGGSTLMETHLSMDKLEILEDPLKLPCSTPLQNLFGHGKILNRGLQNESYIQASHATKNQTVPRRKRSLEFGNNHSQMGDTHNHGKQVVDLDMACGDTCNAKGFTGTVADTDTRRCSCSSPGKKKRVWESSQTSLKSKKVKGGHQPVCNLGFRDFVCKTDGRNSSKDKDSPVLSGSRYFLDAKDSFTSSSHEETDECRPVNCVLQDQGTNERLSRGRSFTIMLMNIADDAKKSNLSKIIEDLGGAVTSDGSLSTHVVTGKVRKTLNFCAALCSGAWILSQSWLKESCRNGKFMDEMPFILKDVDYELKYQIELKDAVQRAKDSPRALFKGYKVCLAAHLQPPVHDLSAIVRSAGGDVIRGLEKATEVSETIFLACEEDMEEAMCAMGKGIRTFCSDWFMNCIMRQELDLDAPQFAESL